MTEQQQAALVLTMLYFMGKNEYAPTPSAVLAQLREEGVTLGSSPTAGTGTATLGWNVSANKKV